MRYNYNYYMYTLAVDTESHMYIDYFSLPCNINEPFLVVAKNSSNMILGFNVLLSQKFPRWTDKIVVR